MSDVLYTLQECGCLALALVDEPDNLKDCAKDIAAEMRKGRTLHRIDVKSFRAGTPALRCPTHQTEAEAKKVKAEALAAQPGIGL